MTQPPSSSSSSPPGWSPTPALRRALVLALFLLVAAVVGGRVDLAILAMPFVVGTATALRFRPQRQLEVGLSTEQVHLVEGNDLALEIAVANPDPSSYDLILIRRDEAPWLADQDGRRTLATVVGGGQRSRITVGGEIRRWGRHTYAPVRVDAVGADGLLVAAPVLSPPLALKVFPRTDPFEADDA
ncbi:MAG TPA: DUF58 domain-containing protein, partial [Actinopolymorphaceae bacterium]|nr:DUF58 domain-containing protein [Actinopolymorphaceae bacterium]